MNKVSQGKLNYLRTAIQKVYKDEDDSIIIGLTGRTGSGCSTVASLLQKTKKDLNNTLYCGDAPKSNEQRKEKIIHKYYAEKWEPFLLIQVRSIITTFLLDIEPESVLRSIGSITQESMNARLTELLSSLRNDYLRHKNTIENTVTHISTVPESDFIHFITNELPRACEEIKEEIGESQFVKFYQEIGKNIRISGEPFNNELVEGKFFTIADRIDIIIRAINRIRKSDSRSSFIVIDAIRNPLEAIYFHERYTSFFMAAVSAPEEDRIARLHKQKYSPDDIKLLNKNEYTTHSFDSEDFYSVQDIKSCLERADLYISNPDVVTEVNKFQGLANQLIRFVSLIRCPGIVTPTAFERCMQIAYTAKLNSGCISRQVGAVITDPNFSIRSIGWNDAPHGQVPCNLRNRYDLINGKDPDAYSHFEKTNIDFIDFLKSDSLRFNQIEALGRNATYCFRSNYNTLKNEKNQVYTRALHAEENAILQISKYGLAGLENGILFTTASPCELCSKKAYQLGIKRICYIDPYPGIAIDHILKGGEHNPELILFTGAIGRAFHRLFTPILPYKDEMEALSCND